VGFEPDLIMAEQYPGSGKVAHMVAIVKIEESLLGAQGITHVRVGFTPSQQAMMNEDFGVQQQAKLVRYWRGPANLNDGQEACFFLQRPTGTDFYLPVNMGYPLDKSDVSYPEQLTAVRKILKSVAQPIEALRAKEAADRQLAACALVMKYRTPGTKPNPAFEAIPAEESKLILNALAEMKWGENPFDVNGALSLHSLFYQLRLTDKDGWVQPQQKENEDYNAIMSKAVTDWMKNKSSTYRMQRFVAAKSH